MARHDSFADWNVVEISSGFGVATLTGKLLADLGCAVTKLEPPDGDPLRHEDGAAADGPTLFHLVSGTKASIRLRLDDSRATDLLRRVLGDANVLVTDFTGWTGLCRTLGEAALRRDFPRLTICVATPFGMTGPMAHWQGNEEIVQAVSGIISTTGHLGAASTRIASATVTHTAAMHAVSSILADMMRKRRGERGKVIEACMFDAAIGLLTAALPAYFLEGVPPKGIGNRHTMAAPWNSFHCADGWVIVCAGNDPTWNRLCAVIGRSDLLTNPDYATQERRVANVDALEREITAWTQTRTIAQVEEIMDRHGIPCGSILSLDQVLTHQQFAERALMRGTGPDAVAGAVFQREWTPAAIATDAPGDAQHVLTQRFNIDRADVERWRDQGLLLDARRTDDVVPAA